MIIHELNLGIYPRKIWLIIGGTEKGIASRFSSIIEVNVKESIEINDAFVLPVRECSTRKLGCIVNFTNKKSMTSKIIAHEAVHIADYIWKEIDANIGNFDEGNEPYAYLVGYIVELITNIKKCYNKTIK